MNKEPDAVEGAVQKIGKDIKAIVSFGSGHQVISLSKKQYGFVSHFMRTGDMEGACAVAGVERSRAVGWFRQARFRQFLKDRIEAAAKINGFDLYRWQSRMIDIFEGRDKDVTPAMLKAGELLGRYHKWIQPENAGPTNIKDSKVQIIYDFGTNTIQGPDQPPLLPTEGSEPGIRRNDANGGPTLGQDGIRGVETDSGNPEAK